MWGAMISLIFEKSENRGKPIDLKDMVISTHKKITVCFNVSS